MFLDKLKGYFRLRDAKETIKPEYASSRNEYYGRVSERFSTAQMILYVVLTVFVLVSLMINSEWITYENFYYFFSDMGDYITASDSEIEDVIYKADRKQAFSMYGGKFAVAGNSGMKLYTSSGRLIIDDDDEISNPKLRESDRYLLMYDHGNTEFRIYNIFTEAFSANTDFAIYGADVADSGDFALVTADNKNSFAVHVYNNKFKLQKTYGKNGYVVDVAISSTGSSLAILSYSASGGEMNTEIYITRTDRAEPLSVVELDGSMPLYCEFTDMDRLIVVCDDAVYSFSSTGTKILELKFEKGTQTLLADVNEHGAAVVTKSSDKYELTVLDKSGNRVYNNALTDTVESVAICGGTVFIDTDDKIQKLDLLTRRIDEIEFSMPNAVMLAKSDNELLICLPNRVEYINFS